MWWRELVCTPDGVVYRLVGGLRIIYVKTLVLGRICFL